MASEFEIGRVVAVDTGEVTIELNRDLKALTKTTYEGTHEIGRINSYVTLPIGARRLVAMVTRVLLVEEAELKADRTMITLPAARRLMKATLVGTIDGESFTQGVTVFPVLDNPVNLVTKADLDVIFDRRARGSTASHDPENPGFCVDLGESPIFEGYPIKINPDAFFGKHAAVIGSTGSGKSCTIASLIQSILMRPDVRQTNIVILDTNGEYRSAFQNQEADGTWTEIGQFNCFHIPSDPSETQDRLVIPYWFMSSDDFVRLFRASPGIQRPVLLDGLRLARTPAMKDGQTLEFREVLLVDLHRIMAQAGESGKTSAEVEDLAAGCLRYIESKEADASALLGDDLVKLKTVLSDAKDKARNYVGEPDKRRFSKPVPIDIQQQIMNGIRPVVERLAASVPGEQGHSISADSPLYFAKESFRGEYLEKAMQRDEAGGARARDYCATMLMRVYRLLEDHRFEFLFGPVKGQWPRPEHSLALFIRDCLGLPAPPDSGKDLSDEAEVLEGVLPFYDRQRDGTTGHNVVILDLSLLAAEVLENVTALIGRLILEFLQRLGEYDPESRGSLPVILVLEEAQNYIREQRFGEDESISRAVFERIAREGRKFGLGLVVASQRPSELSKTVLSQCSSFIVHRLQNPEDLRYFKEIVPGIYEPLLRQLPALAPQTALVLGECVRAPALVRIREARPVPRSRDPKFYKYWVDPHPKLVPVEEVCEKWEGKNESL